MLLYFCQNYDISIAESLLTLETNRLIVKPARTDSSEASTRTASPNLGCWHLSGGVGADPSSAGSGAAHRLVMPRTRARGAGRSRGPRWSRSGRAGQQAAGKRPRLCGAGQVDAKVAQTACTRRNRRDDEAVDLGVESELGAVGEHAGCGMGEIGPHECGQVGSSSDHRAVGQRPGVGGSADLDPTGTRGAGHVRHRFRVHNPDATRPFGIRPGRCMAGRRTAGSRGRNARSPR